jgi:type VI secretion system secreted protein VgrG
MSMIDAPKYSFRSKQWPEDTFTVIDFQGTEGLSLCYRFEINLVSTRPDIDLKKTMQHPATFTIHREAGDLPFHGILTELSIHQAYQDYVFYHAVLTPKFWWLDLTRHNQVFLEMTAPEILKAVLEDGGLSSLDYELRLQDDYPEWEYVCQYGETHHDFACRWMEREGIYYFFEQTDQGETLILTDSKLAHVPMPQGRTLYYSPPSGLDVAYRQEVIHSLFCRQSLTPQRVKVKDYNYRTPSLNLWGESDVSPELGRGEFYVYGEHVRTPEEGDRLASVMAESLLCREQVFTGQSDVPFFRPGYVFELDGHFREEFNQPYLTTEVRHQGSQAGYLTAGLRETLSVSEKEPVYQNHFTVIPAQMQFRPERKTPKARLYGTMNAKIDASGSGQYAELDDQGRYKVVLPFDLSGRDDGKASTWLRMMQPYGGADHGMHFPLHKGTEVLLTFIDGDPDRPIIAGAVPNTDHPSPVNTANQTMNRITTGGQNKIHIEDKEGSQYILLKSPQSNAFLHMGAPKNHTAGGQAAEKKYNEAEDDSGGESDDDKPGEYNVHLRCDGDFKVETGTWQEFVMGHKWESILGSSEDWVVANHIKTVLGLKNDLTIGNSFELRLGGSTKIEVPEDTSVGINRTALRIMNQNITANKQDIAAVENNLKAAVNDVIGDHLKTLALQQQTIAQRTDTIAAAVRNLASETQNAATLMKNVITSNRNIAEDINAVAQRNENIVNAVNNIGTSTNTIGENTNLNINNTTISTATNFI